MNFSELNAKILTLDNQQGIDFSIIGYSLLNKPIYCAHIGNYEGNQIICEGAIHAREWITASLLVDICKYSKDKISSGGIYFIPLINPDGVEFVLDGVNKIKCEKLRQYLVQINANSQDFSLWKANANAVDLNVNFNALWGGGAQNVFCVAPANFVGYYPDSEREVNTLINFTNLVNPALTLSWHTKGEVIYYGFETLTQTQIERDRQIAIKLSELNGYQIIKTENSTGGYSDWVSQNFEVPAFTVEVGNSAIPHPIGEEYLPIIFEQNKEVALAALDIVNNENIAVQTDNISKRPFVNESEPEILPENQSQGDLRNNISKRPYINQQQNINNLNTTENVNFNVGFKEKYFLKL